MYHQPPFYANPYSHPAHTYYYYPSGPMPNQSSVNLNFTRDFDRHAFTSIPSAVGGYPFYDMTNPRFDQYRWRPPFYRNQQQRFQAMPAFHFQDKSTFYYMSDPIYTDDRITIQLTKVHIGPNGDQQRVFVEQEFSNEYELKKFVRNLRHNFEKTFNHRATGGRRPNATNDEKSNFNGKKSGVFVVEEPDEEPKIYPQQDSTQPLKESIQFDDSTPRRQSSVISSSSTVRAHPRRKNKGKARRQNANVDPSSKENHPPQDQSFKRASRIFPTPSYSRYYDSIPPRFQMKENDFRMRTDFGVPQQPWKHHQGYPPPPPGRYRRPRPPPPATIVENRHFPHDEEKQATRVERTRSECRPLYNGTRIYLDSGPTFRFPYVPLCNKVSRPVTPMIYYPPHSRAKPMQHRRRLFPSQRF